MYLKSWRLSFSIFLLFACAATAILAPLASNYWIPGNFDIMNHIAGTIQAKIALTEGQFPLKIAPLEQNGWLYPYYQFYSTTGYLFSGLIHLFVTPSNPYVAYKIAMWSAMVIGAIYMYRLSFWFVKSPPAAILASIVYLYSPYYPVVINHMAAFNEAIALGILPVVLFYTLQKLYFPTKNILLLQTSLAWYLLATTHLSTFINFSLFLAPLLLLIIYTNKIAWKNLIGVAISYIFSLALAMWYLAPIGLFSKYFYVMRTIDIFLEQPLSRLFSPILNISKEASVNAVSLHPGFGLPILIAVSICLYAVVNKIKLEKSETHWMPALLFMFLITLFIIWSPINFWPWIPNYFKTGQYSWRYLGQTLWMGSLLFAWAICWMFDNKLDAKHVTIGILLIITATNSFLKTPEYQYGRFENIIQKPNLSFNERDYTIDSERNFQFVNNIDKVSLDQLIEENIKSSSGLKLNSPAYITHFLMMTSSKPIIIVEGNLPNKFLSKDLILNAVVNHSIVASYKLKPGILHWSFPLNLKPTIKDEKTFDKSSLISLQFKVTKNGKPFQSNFKIPVNSVMLDGLLKSSEVYDVAKTFPVCHNNKGKIACKIYVPKGVHLLELPVLYFPGLLNITLNGQAVSYDNVLYKKQLLATIIPQAGKVNDIVIEFRGLPWANYVSLTTWYLWFLFFVYIILRNKKAA